MAPLIVTLLVASKCTGVFNGFLLKVSVAPAATLMVVKLKMPLAGRFNVVFDVTLSAPSAPVLPVSKGWASAALPVVAAITIANLVIRWSLVFILLPFFNLLKSLSVKADLDGR